MMLRKCCTQYLLSKFGKLNSDHRTGKGQFSFQSQRKTVPKNIQTTIQLCSFHATKVILKILQARLQQYLNKNFHFQQLSLNKSEEPQIKLPVFIGSQKKQGNSRKISISDLLTMPKPLTVWITTNCRKFFKKWEYQTI